MQVDTEIERLRQMADSLDSWILEDYLALSQYTEKTAEQMRKRGQGPAYMRLGKRVLYPKKAVAEFLASRVRQTHNPIPRGAL
ncbi:hypothetical protein DBA29_03585 [Xenophilus aerolatus]|nr:hypothetical protein [Xenophilus aerolatus]